MSRKGDPLADRIETTDGSRPEAEHQDAGSAKRAPLSAFGILRGGDVFEGTGRPPPGTDARAKQYVHDNVQIRFHAEQDVEYEPRIHNDISRQLSGNSFLIERMAGAKPLTIDVIPVGKSIAAFGYPRAVSRHAAGLFWSQPKWERGRIALRADMLPKDPVLVVHEFAHAIHYLGFTKEERDLIYNLLRPTFGSKAAMDEVFAIYSEREFTEAFGKNEKRAPGVYGFTRRQWDENHVFTRFVRKLYYPYRQSAGPKLAGSTRNWMQGLSRS